VQSLRRGVDQATIAYAESMEALLDVRFTDPAAALYVNVQSDSIESLFAMSTSRVPGAPEPPVATLPRQARSAGTSGSAQGRATTNKRPFEETTMRRRTPAKVVERISPPALRRGASGAQPPAPSHAPTRDQPLLSARLPTREPLFLPGSQMSAADREALRASGLGDMDADEFNAMMEDDGEEVGLNFDPPDDALDDALASSVPPPPPPPVPPSPAPDSDVGEHEHWQDVNRFEDDIESEMGPTQSDESGKVCPPIYPFRACVKMFHTDRPCVRGAWQAFRPLFDD
jgi:cell cycle checkpoint control protein RAD9A